MSSPLEKKLQKAIEEIERIRGGKNFWSAESGRVNFRVSPRPTTSVFRETEADQNSQPARYTATRKQARSAGNEVEKILPEVCSKEKE